MCTRNVLDVILRQIAGIYRDVYGDNIVRILLYGSYARGDYQMDSDIDIVAMIPFEEFEKYKNDLPYYRNIQNEGVDIVA